MTYLFKLASRISRLRTALPMLLLSAVACMKGEKVDFLGPNPNGSAPSLQSIRIEPKVASVHAGTPIRFTATGYGPNGSPIPVSVDWTSQGGSITADGEYTGAAAGQFTVLARARGVANLADSASVGVWNAPLDPVALVISPDSALIEEGDSLDFTAALLLANSTVAGGAVVSWTANGGSITPGGAFTAAQSGIYTVSAETVLGLRGSATVFVRARLHSLQRITLNPRSSTLGYGATATYTVTGLYTDGTSGQPEVAWSATGGSVNSAGVFTAGSQAGSYQVVARNAQGTLADTAAVTIGAPSVVALSIAPKVVALQSGASVSFSSLARLSDGSFTAIAVNYQATGGSINSQGTFVAGSTAGTYRVIVTALGVAGADTATISIVQPVATLTGIILNPASVSLGTGQTRQFTATGVWSDGSSADPAVSWAATGGSITSSGSYVAGSAPGTYRVIATAAGGVADTSQVTVLPAVLSSLTLTPATGTVLAGQSLQFSVAGTWSDGSASAPGVTWTATGGTITNGGLYTGGGSGGTYWVIATHQGGTLADTSLVTITPTAPVLTSLGVSPAAVVLAQGASQQFNAFGVWSDGSTGTPAITWSATGGTVTSAGRYTAGSTPGTFRVIGSAGGKADTSTVTISAPAATLASLSVWPKPTTVQTASPRQFSATALWSNGDTTVPPLSWTATGGTITNNGLYTAGSAAGTFRVIASGAGKADTAPRDRDRADRSRGILVRHDPGRDLGRRGG